VPLKWSIYWLLLAMPGCYLAHVALGQARLLHARRPIAEVIADPTTPAQLRERLGWIHEVRAFATRLGLSSDDQYTSYVEWPGDRVVTSVVATPPGSLEPHRFWFPIVGHVPYKGFFDAARAHEEAESLRAEGFDVCEVPVRAYSTLGWFEDPVTEPMLRGSEGALVETLLHELVHATVFVASQADFNEGVASFVGEEGSVRFFAEKLGAAAAERERARVGDARTLARAMLAFRTEVADLYASESRPEARDAQRAAAEARARASIAALPLLTRDAARLAVDLRLSDACLGLTRTYAADVDAYAATLASLAGSLPDFVARLREAAGAQDPRAFLLAR
jgi:predicted aminopeptidase